MNFYSSHKLKEDHRIFVYGTLMPKSSEGHRLKKIGGSWQDAYIYCFYDQEGWGMTEGYPGIVVPGPHLLTGYLFSSLNLPQHWDSLDDYEGDRYLRQLVEVTVLPDTKVLAHTYVLHPQWANELSLFDSGAGFG